MTANITPAEYRETAAAHDATAARSYERHDTDGFLSQWADGIMARENRAKADLAENGGMSEFVALFNIDGSIASVRTVTGPYGESWLLNDATASRYGKRFFSESAARNAQRRYTTNRTKGFTLGTIRVTAHVTLTGSGTGLAGAASVGVGLIPDRDALEAGDFTIVTTDNGPGENW